MRTTSLIVLALAIMFACSSQKEIVVGADKSPDADFDQYQTYSWTGSANDNSNLSYTFNDANLKQDLKDAIKYELDARGYKMDNSDPDLLVNFRVLNKATDFPGYRGSPETGYWGTTIQDGVYEEEDQKEYNLERGSVLVDLVDADDAKLIWQGYASGVVDQEANSQNDKPEIKDAVQMIFNKYDHRAGNSGSTRSSGY